MLHFEFQIRWKTLNFLNTSYDFPNNIEKIIVSLNHIFILLYPLYNEDERSLNNKQIKIHNNVYCFSIKGELLWQNGKMKFTTYGGNTHIHPVDDMFIDGDLLKISYQMGLYRWLNPETGEVVKEEWDKYGR